MLKVLSCAFQAEPKATLASLVGTLAGHHAQPHSSHGSADSKLHSIGDRAAARSALPTVAARPGAGATSAAVSRFGDAAALHLRPPHDHHRPCWAQPGAAACRPLLRHINSMAVPLERDELDRCVTSSACTQMTPRKVLDVYACMHVCVQTASNGRHFEQKQK